MVCISLSEDYAVARCLFAVFLPGGDIVSIRLDIFSDFFSPSGSSTILVFSVPNVMAVFRRGPPMWASNAGGMKSRNFQLISRVTSEMMQDRAIVTMERRSIC